MPLSASKHFRVYSLIALAVAAVFVWHATLASLPSQELKFYALDVGQGDSLFIETPHKRQVLIDGGPDASVLRELGEVMAPSDRSIDLVVLTHPQADHMFGLLEVLRRYSVGMVLMTGVNYESATHEEFKALLKEKRVPIVVARAGQRVVLDSDATLDVLYPLERLWGTDFAGDVNDASVAALITFKGKKFLSMGDAGIKEELDVASLWPDLDVDVLKVNHHGSRSSSNALFLERTKPEFAVISVGAKNRYGHPTQEAMERLEGAEVFRTDTQGRVMLATDGERIRWETER